MAVFFPFFSAEATNAEAKFMELKLMIGCSTVKRPVPN
jgi:hypothetical protein